jgi:hypothetical protein
VVPRGLRRAQDAHERDVVRGRAAAAVIEISRAGIDLYTGACKLDVSFDSSAAAAGNTDDRWFWDLLVPWWAHRRMEIGAEVAGAAGIALPYAIVDGKVRPHFHPTPGLKSYWEYADEQWAATVPAPCAEGIAGLQRMFRALGFHERQPSVSGTAAQILSLRTWVGEGEVVSISAPSPVGGLRVPLDAVALPQGWEGKVRWSVDLPWDETPPEAIDDCIGPLEMVLAANRSGAEMHVQMDGGFGDGAGAWIATRLGGRAGRLEFY